MKKIIWAIFVIFLLASCQFKATPETQEANIKIENVGILTLVSDTFREDDGKAKYTHSFTAKIQNKGSAPVIVRNIQVEIQVNEEWFKKGGTGEEKIAPEESERILQTIKKADVWEQGNQDGEEKTAKLRFVLTANERKIKGPWQEISPNDLEP